MRGDTLDRWFISNSFCEDEHIGNNNFIEYYEMPRKSDWNLFKRIYDIHPQNYEQLISISGVGPGTVRALSLIGELIYGTKASWKDPVKYNFAHGIVILHKRYMINRLDTSLLQLRVQR